MPGSDEVERKIREMLIEMGDCRLLAKFEGAMKADDERNCRVEGMLEDLLHEVDELLLKMDQLDGASPECEECEDCEDCQELEEKFIEESAEEICTR
jgi:hypothetical protein